MTTEKHNFYNVKIPNIPPCGLKSALFVNKMMKSNHNFIKTLNIDGTHFENNKDINSQKEIEFILLTQDNIENCIHKHFESKYDEKLNECRDLAQGDLFSPYETCLGQLNDQIIADINP